jgi:hypothetical protein
MKHNTGLKCPLKGLCRLCRQPLTQQKEEAYVKKRVLYLALAALVAMLILVPTAMAQTETTVQREVQMEGTQPLPKSGGVSVGSASVLFPAAALLLGAGVLGVAVLRRR